MNTRSILTVLPAALCVLSSPALAAEEAASEEAIVSEAARDSESVSFSASNIASGYSVSPVTAESIARQGRYALAQDGAGGAAGGREASYTVALNQDSFFGFNPSFNGLIPVNETMDFSFYGIFWTKPAFGLGQGNTGDDLWTEFGVGVNFNLMDGKLKVKPQLGITNGSLLSGGQIAGGNTQGARFLDGIVPSLTINYSDDTFEAEYYGGYYAALRQRNGNAALDFAHTWLNFGYKATSNVSFGPHYELLYNTRNTYPGGNTAKTYEWLGGYVQFSLPKGLFARFTGGGSIGSGDTGDFYKMSVGMSF
ncbi:MULTISPECIES: DUF6733 family protein [Novosphingobium]|uniref:DUF6733 family protein n=1 Tax=Novosphingobium TaxID=165696 RepID=UPI000D6DED31|nr:MULTISPECIES: DUF6733 family protein [Novosphingobium]